MDLRNDRTPIARTVKTQRGRSEVSIRGNKTESGAYTTYYSHNDVTEFKAFVKLATNTAAELHYRCAGEDSCDYDTIISFFV